MCNNPRNDRPDRVQWEFRNGTKPGPIRVVESAKGELFHTPEVVVEEFPESVDKEAGTVNDAAPLSS
jgi:hypothetical protein